MGRKNEGREEGEGEEDGEKEEEEEGRGRGGEEGMAILSKLTKYGIIYIYAYCMKAKISFTVCLPRGHYSE